MEKVLSKYGLLISVVIIYVVSILINLTGICCQGEAFIYLMDIFIVIVTIIMTIRMKNKYYEVSKSILFIAKMYLLYTLIAGVAYEATIMFNADFVLTIQLLTLGLALGNAFPIRIKE